MSITLLTHDVNSIVRYPNTKLEFVLRIVSYSSYYLDICVITRGASVIFCEH